MDIKIATWNLNHRIRKKEIPDSFFSIMKALNPDLFVLTEYVDCDERLPFKQRLEQIGYTKISVSARIAGQNQVLIASRVDHELGDLQPPSFDQAAVSNFLHVGVPVWDIEIVGLRVPWYTLSSERTSYWRELEKIIDSVKSRKIIFIGDFNCDPNRSRTFGARKINSLREEGWQVPVPQGGDWSYISSNGKKRSSIDHVIGSPHIDGKIHGRYIAEVNWHVAAGVKEREPISDHAILFCEINQKEKIDYFSKPRPIMLDLKDIDELVAFLPRLYRTGRSKPVVEWKGGKQEDNGCFTLPWPVYSDDVEEFFQLTSKPCWSDTKYVPSEAGAMIDDEEFIKNATLAQCRTLLTYCTRGERFCSGHWGDMIKKGVIRSILNRLKEIRELSKRKQGGQVYTSDKEQR
jgi:hypothetical protein